jgi:hypothetical protein
MTIPHQKIEREWKDPDEFPGHGIMSYFNYFDGKFFLLIVVMWFLTKAISHTPITVLGLIIMLVTSIALSPLLNILFKQLVK